MTSTLRDHNQHNMDSPSAAFVSTLGNNNGGGGSPFKPAPLRLQFDDQRNRDGSHNLSSNMQHRSRDERNDSKLVGLSRDFTLNGFGTSSGGEDANDARGGSGSGNGVSLADVERALARCTTRHQFAVQLVQGTQMQEHERRVLAEEGCAECLLQDNSGDDLSSDQFVVLRCNLLQCSHVLHLGCLLSASSIPPSLATLSVTSSSSHSPTPPMSTNQSSPSLDVWHCTNYFRCLHHHTPSPPSPPGHPSLKRLQSARRQCLVEFGLAHHISNAQILHINLHTPMATYVDGSSGNDVLDVQVNGLNQGEVSVSSSATGLSMPSAQFTVTRGKVHFRCTDMSTGSISNHVCNYDLTPGSPSMLLVLVDQQTRNILSVHVRAVRNGGTASNVYEVVSFKYEFCQQMSHIYHFVPPLHYDASASVDGGSSYYAHHAGPMGVDGSGNNLRVYDLLHPSGSSGTVVPSLYMRQQSGASVDLNFQQYQQLLNPTSPNSQQQQLQQHQQQHQLHSGQQSPRAALYQQQHGGNGNASDPPMTVSGRQVSFPSWTQLSSSAQQFYPQGQVVQPSPHHQQSPHMLHHHQHQMSHSQPPQSTASTMGKVSTPTNNSNSGSGNTSKHGSVYHSHNNSMSANSLGGGVGSAFHHNNSGHSHSGSLLQQVPTPSNGAASGNGNAGFLRPSHSPLSSATPTITSPPMDGAADSIYLSLDQLTANVVKHAKTHAGSRFLQSKLEAHDLSYFDLCINEILSGGSSAELMIDHYGHFTIEKLLLLCSPEQLSAITQSITSSIITISCQKHGSFSIQTLIDCISPSNTGLLEVLMESLKYNLLTLITHPSGHFVVLKILQRFPYQYTSSIDSVIKHSLYDIAVDHHGLRVLKMYLHVRTTNAAATVGASGGTTSGAQSAVNGGNSNNIGNSSGGDVKQTGGAAGDALTTVSLDAIHDISTAAVDLTLNLVENSYGNYFIQSLLDVCSPSTRSAVKNKMIGHWVKLSQSKFSSNVVEKCLQQSHTQWRNVIINELIDPRVIKAVITDRYSNYVCQTAVTVADGKQLDAIAGSVTPHLATLRENVRKKWKTLLQQAKHNLANKSSTPPSSLNKPTRDGSVSPPPSSELRGSGSIGAAARTSSNGSANAGSYEEDMLDTQQLHMHTMALPLPFLQQQQQQQSSYSGSPSSRAHVQQQQHHHYNNHGGVHQHAHNGNGANGNA